MNMSFYLISAVLMTCAQTMWQFEVYQAITGINPVDLIENNPAEMQAITMTVINTVQQSLREIPTEVFLSDSDMWSLLNYAIETCGGGNLISGEILRELGLYTNSVITYLLMLGFSIF